MKKVIFVFVLFMGIGGAAIAQEATKTKKAPNTRAELASKKSTAVAETTLAETAEAEVAVIREVPVYDANGNQSGTKRVAFDKNGKMIKSPATLEAEKAKKLEAEAAKPSKKY